MRPRSHAVSTSPPATHLGEVRLCLGGGVWEVCPAPTEPQAGQFRTFCAWALSPGDPQTREAKS